jgi:hypothetical protein
MAIARSLANDRLLQRAMPKAGTQGTARTLTRRSRNNKQNLQVYLNPY